MLSPVSRDPQIPQTPAVAGPGQYHVSVVLQKSLQRPRRGGGTVHGGVLPLRQLRDKKQMIQMSVGDADVAHPFKILQGIRIASSLQLHKGVEQKLLPAGFDEDGGCSKPGYLDHGSRFPFSVFSRIRPAVKRRYDRMPFLFPVAFKHSSCYYNLKSSFFLRLSPLFSGRRPHALLLRPAPAAR